ncbi:unnamed protein product [Pleuronectes platessa]|uniref:Uncharacterized protein n=1 Tax=Pleuronectes platessa TaxID=8262 RepID=A0A9N7W0U8_PLEPL|nr:unnamed protein product [Pleuronectes platessa]
MAAEEKKREEQRRKEKREASVNKVEGDEGGGDLAFQCTSRNSEDIKEEEALEEEALEEEALEDCGALQPPRSSNQSREQHCRDDGGGRVGRRRAEAPQITRCNGCKLKDNTVTTETPAVPLKEFHCYFLTGVFVCPSSDK